MWAKLFLKNTDKLLCGLPKSMMLGILFIHSITRPHAVTRTFDVLQESEDFFLFSKIKSLRGNWFPDANAVVVEFLRLIEKLPKN